MKAVRKSTWKIVSIVAVAGAVLMQCANPADKDVRWRTSVDLPVTAHKKFFLGAMMDTLFFSKKQVQTSVSYDTIERPGLPDTIIKLIDTTMQLINGYPLYDSVAKKTVPDTVAFGFPTHDTASSTISEDSLDDKTYRDVFGPIPISNTPATDATIPLSGAYTGGTPFSTPALPVTMKYVYRLELSNAVQSVNVQVKNNSQALFSNVRITLGPLGPSNLENLAAGATGTLTFNASGKIIDSVISVTATLTPQSSGTFAAGNTMAIGISLNGLIANRVVVLDSMLASYSRTFTNNYDLTDTIDLEYVDIDKGFFIYEVYNHTKLNMLLTVTHRHLWRSDFCQAKTPSLIELEDLVGMTASDSLVAYNGAVANNESFLAGQKIEYRKQNISGNRLFPEWDAAVKQSVTKVDYRVCVGVFGRRVTLLATDSLMFVIKATSFKFKEMYGESMEEYNRMSDPSVIPVKLPWNKSVTDSLRDNFKLQKVLAKVRVRMDIPERAVIDTMKVHYVITSVTHPAVACSSDAVLLHVMRDSTYERPIDITDVVNDYPDSVKVNISLKIPVHTHVKAVNDLLDPKDPDYPKYIGRMIIKGLVNYNMVAPLCWTVVDTASMDLGGDTLNLKKAGFVTDPFKKMTDRHADFIVDVTNYTNVYLKLYALVATDSNKVGPLVDTSNKAAYISTNQLTQYINTPTPGFVRLLGDGLLIPPRDSVAKVRNAIKLSENDLNQILGAKVSGWRWQVRFLPRYSGGAVVTTPDALKNTDWIKLNSWIHIDGVNSIDSLIQ